MKSAVFAVMCFAAAFTPAEVGAVSVKVDVVGYREWLPVLAEMIRPDCALMVCMKSVVGSSGVQ